MAGIERRPASGSCSICRAALDLVSVEVGGVWYCSTACIRGRPAEKELHRVVPETWLIPVPRRFYRKRRPTELRSKKPSS